MIITAQSLIKDRPATWGKELTRPPVFDREGYQKQLDAISGRSRGRSILRLEWGGNEVMRKYDGWTATGIPILAVPVPKHAIPRVDSNTGLEVKIPIRRWIITQLQEPEQYGYGDDSDMYFTDENGAACKVAEKDSELYTPLIYIGDHSKCPDNCCEGRICLGDYKHPGRAELEWVKETTFDLRKNYKYNPYEPLSQSALDEIERDRKYTREKKREKIDEEFDFRMKEWFKVHGHRLTSDDPSVLTHGKYKFFKDGKPI